MADLKIYNNGENKILMSAGDRIIRQPYEFGKAFRRVTGFNTYMLIENIGLPDDFGYYMIQTNESTGNNQLMALINTSLNKSDQVWTRRDTAKHRINIADNVFNTQVTLPYLGLMYMFSYSDRHDIYRGSDILTVPALRNEGTRDIVRVGTSGYLDNNIVAFNGYMDESTKINKLVFLDRPLSISEVRFIENNLLYQNPQTRSGIIHEYNFEKAEILTFSGVDYVAIRDLVGGAHGKIMNLPAGTLQEQLDWANANLFVPFIS
mgnify:CR=1 FL=1